MTCDGRCPTLLALQARVEQLEARDAGRHLSRSDLLKLESLLPVITATFGSENFKVHELLQADAPGLRLVLGACSAKSVGRLFRRAVGHPVGGYLVQRVGTEDNAAIWQVVKVVS